MDGTMLARHLLAIAVLPFVVTVIVPISIARTTGVTIAAPQSVGGAAAAAAGLAAGGAGVVLFAASLRRFAGEGEGTLAPWDPPRRLVVRGPYRFVRNPMISGVLFVLAGEALVLRSWPHAAWAAAFLGINALFILAIEEPQLRSRFGASYDEYCRHVPRVIPRVRPWDGPVEGPRS